MRLIFEDLRKLRFETYVTSHRYHQPQELTPSEIVFSIFPISLFFPLPFRCTAEISLNYEVFQVSPGTKVLLRDANHENSFSRR